MTESYRCKPLESILQGGGEIQNIKTKLKIQNRKKSTDGLDPHLHEGDRVGGMQDQGARK
jgi:hypothetical protein